jgi:UDP-N-acetylmuramoyl-tripeptide--D-alanyl-D-alanine ligase
VKENSETMVLDWISESETTTIHTNLVGNYNFENAMAAICTGSYFKVPAESIKDAISNYLPSNSRSQAMKTGRNSIILDAYNANPTSMQAAIENFRQLKADHKMVILGDMLELGEESTDEHKAIIRLLENCSFEKVVLVGPEFTMAAGNKYTSFTNSGDAFTWLKDQQITNYAILVKGSRGIKMEKVLDAL